MAFVFLFELSSLSEDIAQIKSFAFNCRELCPKRDLCFLWFKVHIRTHKRFPNKKSGFA
jgi:hypothetical protein